MLILTAGAIGSACANSSSTTSSSGGGSSPGVCPLYGGPTNFACPSNEPLVCGFSGQATGCCPTVAPYYCGSTQSCYPSANEASAACGTDCQQCSTMRATTTSSSSSASSGSSSGSCNAGTILSPPGQGLTCPNGQACTQAPFSCLTEGAIQDGLVCCCSSDGTICVGCLPTETCSGPLNGSAVSCCSM